MAGFSLGGFVAGPIIFSLFSYAGDYYSVVGPFMLATFLSFISFLACLFFFPETLPKDKIKQIPNLNFLTKTLKNTFENIIKVFKNKSTQGFLLASFVFNFAFAGFNTFSSQYLFENYKFTSGKVGVYFLIVGIVMTLMQAFLGYKIARKIPLQKSIIYLSLGIAFAMLVFAFSYSLQYALVLVFANAALFSFLISINMVSVQTEITKIQTDFKGALLGTFSSVQVLAMAFAPVLMGVLSKYYGNTTPFIIAAILILVSGFLFKRALVRKV
jgi:predicted MFS family arabinose efflux permease